MDLGLENKVALITGAGSQIGFGKGIALSLAKEGCDIIVADVNIEGAKQTVAEVAGLGQEAIACKVDITNGDEVNNTVKAGLDRFGKIDILVNNAGKVTIPVAAEATEDDWDINVGINLKGTWNCSKAVLTGMIARKNGKIVSMASVVRNNFLTSLRTVAGDEVPFRSGSTLYLAAKAGIIGLTRSLAAEVGPYGINVNAIVPGLGDTGLYTELGGLAPEAKNGFALSAPIRRLTTPDDIGKAVVFLVSSAADDITGQTIQVDSGDTMV
jgi:3-oxoacyl-[acyl-carrier protein] reductase